MFTSNWVFKRENISCVFWFVSMCNEILEHTHGRIHGEAATQTCKGGVAPPWTQRFHAFQILNSWMKNIKVRMKNLSRMHIHPNRICAIRDSEVKQLFLNANPRRLEFRGSTKPFFVLIRFFKFQGQRWVLQLVCNKKKDYKTAVQ